MTRSLTDSFRAAAVKAVILRLFVDMAEIASRIVRFGLGGVDLRRHARQLVEPLATRRPTLELFFRVP